MTNEVVNMKPFVGLAVRVMGPGRRRLEMVKLLHELDDGPETPDTHRRAA
jgi:hypothetical protein